MQAENNANIDGKLKQEVAGRQAARRQGITCQTEYTALAVYWTIQ
jgi:hypothetical protein